MYYKKKIIVFGDLPIASKVCDFLINERKDQVELSGVVIGNKKPKNIDPWNIPILINYAKENNIKILTMEDISNSNIIYDLGISARFSKIIKTEVRNQFKCGIINFHGGLLPKFGGLYSVCHTILEGASYGGGTIHYIDEGIDTGNIIKLCKFPLVGNETARSLFQKTQTALFNGFQSILDPILDESITTIKQNDLIKTGEESHYYDKYSLEGKKEFKLLDPLDHIDRVVRAFHNPGHEPAFFKLKGEKYYVTYKEFK